MIRKPLALSVVLLCSLLALLLACAEPLLRFGARHALADTGVVLLQLQDLQLRQDRVTLARLQLQLPSGQRLDLDALTLQLGFHGWRRLPTLDSLSVARGALRPAAAAAPTAAPAAALRLGELLALPGRVPAFALDIAQLQLPWWPAPLQLTLRRSTDLQLELSTRGLHLDAALGPADEAGATHLDAGLQHAGRQLATLQASLSPLPAAFALRAEGQLMLEDLAALWQDLQWPTPPVSLPALAFDWTLDGSVPDDLDGIRAGNSALELVLGLRENSRLTVPATWPGGIGPAELRLRTDSKLQLRGTPEHQQIEGTLELRFAGNSRAPTAVIDGSLALSGSLPQGTLDIGLSLPTLQFSDTMPLSAYLQSWPWPGDLRGGSLALAVDLSRPQRLPGAAAVPLAIRVQASLQELAGHYQEVLFRGLQGELQADLQAGESLLLSTPPLTLQLAELNPGIPLRKLQARLQYDGEHKQLHIDTATAELLGGRISTQAMVYAFGSTRNSATVEFAGLQLAEMLSLANYGAVQATGAISGRVPLTLGPGGVEVQGGSLLADAPGGNIRYAEAAAAGLAGTAELDLVDQVLENFIYDSLSSSIDYSPAGELQLRLQLQGHSPALGSDQPIHLNLNLVDDIPALLQSLQAARSIETFLQEQYRP